ncbi:MAG TPA: DUF3795 domain-containing protein [bacterium]|nr:DUF3795 domain-containing protein [bacterium]HPN43834.1 DUF3795 domain-containing protein [bacterium]
MEQENRRDFLKHGAQLCAICAFSSCIKNGVAQGDPEKTDDKTPDPTKMTFCGYECTIQCELYKATLENNVELKKKVYTDWKMKERRGFDFDPALVFCYGCKVTDKPLNAVLEKCTVRKCAMEKKLAACIQCKALKDCDKELWTNYPEFKKQMLEVQVKYVSLSGKALL